MLSPVSFPLTPACPFSFGRGKRARQEGPRSIILGQQDGADATVGFRNDPDLHARLQGVHRHDPEALLDRQLVFGSVRRTDIASVAALVPLEQFVRTLASFVHRLDCGRRGDQLAQGEADGGFIGISVGL